MRARLLLFSLLALVLLPARLFAQLECSNAGLQYIQSFNANDSAGVLHQNACWNPVTHVLTFPLSPTGSGLSGMTTGQVGIAGSATTITSSKALQGTDASILTSGTISGTSVLLCTDANGGATTSSCPSGGGLSGMAAGQVGIAGSATTITSSKPIQGTDTNLLSSGTISGTSVALCTDANGGATTVSCPGGGGVSGQVVGQFPLPGSATTITATVAAGTNQGTYVVGRLNTTQGTAVTPTENQVGDCSAPGTVTGAGTTYTVVFTDVIGCTIVHDLAASGAATITIPTPATLNNAHPIFIYRNDSAQIDTLSPTTFTISEGKNAAAATLSVPSNTSCKVQLDPVNASTWKADCHVNATNDTLTIASGASAMGTGAITSGTCAAAVTASATGVATTDAIIVSPNADPTGVTGYAVSASGSLYIQAYPTANNVNFKVCNNTAASITPGALTLNWRVVR